MFRFYNMSLFILIVVFIAVFIHYVITKFVILKHSEEKSLNYSFDTISLLSTIIFISCIVIIIIWSSSTAYDNKTWFSNTASREENIIELSQYDKLNPNKNKDFKKHVYMDAKYNGAELGFEGKVKFYTISNNEKIKEHEYKVDKQTKIIFKYDIVDDKQPYVEIVNSRHVLIQSFDTNSKITVHLPSSISIENRYQEEMNYSEYCSKYNIKPY